MQFYYRSIATFVVISLKEMKQPVSAKWIFLPHLSQYLSQIQHKYVDRNYKKFRFHILHFNFVWDVRQGSVQIESNFLFCKHNFNDVMSDGDFPPTCIFYTSLSIIHFLYHGICISCHSVTLKQKYQLSIILHKLISLLFSMYNIWYWSIFWANVSSDSLKTANHCAYQR